MGRTRVRIHPLGLVLLAVLLITVPLQWFCAWLLAAFFHELCHVAAVCMCGGKIRSLSFGSGGTVIGADLLSAGCATFSILAGPLGGLLPILLARFYPQLAVCCLVLSAYNLIPVYPLDGGRVLRLLLAANLSERIVAAIEVGILTVITVLFVVLTLVFSLRHLPLLAALNLLLNHNCAKRPCKDPLDRVQ